jgi:hypothetical protein
MKHNKIKEKEIEEIKWKLQASQRSHQEERGEEELEHLGTMGNGEQQLSAVFTTEEEMEIHQHRDQIHNLRRQIESIYYQVTQTAIYNRPRLQKPHNMSKLKVIMKTANEVMEQMLDQKDLNITELNHLNYAAATVITEEINGTGEYKPQTQRSKPPLWVRRIKESINDMRKKLSMMVQIKQDSRKVKNIKRAKLLKKYNIEKEENFNPLIEELKQKVSAKTQ